ncbi:hypothetical protein B0T10DRAFT_561427 [Thelonectria olida]|uniref:Uncharacterized protein n=1 Tax=Thelonectria olida TaxID=1576542 RepID=A0A9P9AQL5_9HYPO|nr:hypothetical protein B0T10DRAFT_561427 [Thelonectria olida]
MQRIQSPISLFIILAYVTVFLYHTRHSVPVYQAKFRKSSPLPLIIHIAAGLFEAIRYHICESMGPVSSPDIFDFVACLAQSLTSLMLAKKAMRGDKTTRPSYQAPGFVRPVLSTLAFIHGDAGMHRASVKLLNGYLYVRVYIFLAEGSGLNKTYSYSTIYAQSIFLASVLAFYESGLPGGLPGYLVLVGVLTTLNRASSEQMRSISRNGGPAVKKKVIRLLHWIGLAELDTIKKFSNDSQVPKKIEDEYMQ